MDKSKIQVIGDEYSIFDYNLNKQFTTVKKIIVTNKVLLNSFENLKVKEIFEKLSNLNQNSYDDFTSNSNFEEIFETNLSNEFYKKLQEELKKLSNELTDIKLENYNFMNSVSNSKYTVTIRGQGFSKSEYYQEKGKLLFIMKNLIKDFLLNKINILNLSQIKRFQIEIYESEEIYKTVFLKKDANSILLSSSFGFFKNTPINFNCGNEFYFSIGDNFKFYKNKQTNAIIREHNKLENKEINSHEKILSNDELISINKITKDLHDVLIELYINDKGKIKILNVSILENNIYNNSEFGFIINKSEKNYDRISLLTLRNSLEEETLNPKYLLIRSEQEISEFLLNIDIVKKLDGIIFTYNFYNPILDHIGKKFGLDILFLDKNLQKGLDIKFNRENIEIEDSLGNFQSFANPFGTILETENKSKDEFLKKLKNIDLSTPKKEEKDNFETQQISNLAESLISSKNSSINKSNSNTFAGMTDLNKSENGKKLTAMELLAQSVLESKPSAVPKLEIPKIEETKPVSEFSQSSLLMKDVTSKDLEPISENSLDLKNELSQINSESKDLKIEEDNNLNENIKAKYEEILATKIITTPQINSGIYFADMQTLSNISSGEIYFMTTSNQNLNNPHLNYIVPISIENVSENVYLLISSVNDFFLIKNNSNHKYFIGLSNIEKILRKNFLKNSIEKLDVINLIISKEDIDLVEDYINKIDSIFIKDLETDEEYESIKNKILIFEKKFLIRSN